MNDTDVLNVVQKVEAEQDVRFAARIFEMEIRKVLDAAQEKHHCSNKIWTRFVASFLAKFYPLARFSLSLTSPIAEVNSENS